MHFEARRWQNGLVASWELFMGVWWGEYSDREWLQMAACLLGTPLAALLTAWFTKQLYPQRNLVRCTLGGLAASAIIAFAFFVPFVLWVLMFRGSGSAKYFLQMFDSLFGWGLALTAMGGAAVGARVAAHTQRAGGSQGQPGGTVNLRQLFLLQLLPFVVLGGWLGMRSAALNVSPGLERAQRKWSQRGWDVNTDEHGDLLGLARSQSYYSMNPDVENLNLREASRERWVKELRFGVTSDPEAIELAGFASHPRLTHLHLTYAPESSLSTKHLQDVASISSLEFLSLRSAGSLSESLAPLGALPKLQRLSFGALTISPKDFNGLKACKSLKVLAVNDLTLTSLAPIEFPESLEKLTLQTRFLWTPSGENFRAMKPLRQVTLAVGGVTKEELAAIAAAPNLEKLVLGTVDDLAALQLLLQSPRLQQLHFRFGAEDREQEPQLVAALEMLATHPSLAQLQCDSRFFVLPVGGMGISQPSASPPATNIGTLAMPGRIGVGIPLHQQMLKEVQSRIAAVRRERGLPVLEVLLQSAGPVDYAGPGLPRAAYKQPSVQGGEEP